MTPPDTDALNDAKSKSKTLVEFAYGRLREDILHGRHRPGEKLRVELLRNEYQVGSSTLREALSLLVADALVTSEGQRGFRVAPVSLDDLRDITRMRRLLECEAIREAIAQGDDAWEAGVVAAYHRLSRVEERLAGAVTQEVIDEWEERNRAFHEALMAGCASKWLHHFRGILYSQSERYRRMALSTRTIPRDIHAEHEAILRATLARDADAASALLAEHIERTLHAIAAAVPE
jgi:DNA-binding GntR family transcriptional regulator